MPRGGVEGSICQKTESNCKLPAAGPLRLISAPKQGLSPCALIKEKVNSLKETEQTTLEGKSREIKNVTLVSVGEMRFTR